MIEAGSASEASAIGLWSTPQTMGNVQRSILTMEPELENLDTRSPSVAVFTVSDHKHH